MEPCSEVVTLCYLSARLRMEQSFPWQLAELIQVYHWYNLIHHLGFAAFPKISNLVTKQVLYYATYKLYKLHV